MKIITVDENKCVGCNACIRNCQAPEANITKMLEDGSFVTTVNPDKCTACGECIRTCAHGARDYLDDTEEAMETMRRERMIVIAAPAIKAVYPDKWKSILDWFKSKGCLVYDVALGADICSWAHLRHIQYGRVGNLVTQPCAAIVRYAEIYNHELLKNLSPIHSPMLCGVTYIKNYLGQKEKIMALSPCAAKKYEFEETGLVEYNVTFKKLMQYFEKHGVKLQSHNSEDFNYDFDGGQGQVGGIYPRPGGLRDNLWLHDPELDITNSEGVHKVYGELDMYAKLVETKKPKIFDVLSCERGCSGGIGTGTTKTIFDDINVMRGVEANAKSKRKTGWLRGSEDKLFKKYDEILRLEDYKREYKALPSSPLPGVQDLINVFEQMGKHTEEERNYDCHACGYGSCKEMATAIWRGLNVPENCIVHSKALLQEEHEELKESNDALNRKHTVLEETVSDCKKLSDQLNSDVDDILNNIKGIGSSSKETADLAAKVKQFIGKLIMICSKKESMNKEELLKLAELLKQTDVAFASLSESIDSTNSNASSVSSHTEEIRELVSAINETLIGSLED